MTTEMSGAGPVGRIQTFDELSTRELYEILRVRSAVFVLEQNCNYVDMDGIDFRAIHVALWQGSEIVAYCRVFVERQVAHWSCPDDTEEQALRGKADGDGDKGGWKQRC